MSLAVIPVSAVVVVVKDFYHRMPETRKKKALLLAHSVTIDVPLIVKIKCVVGAACFMEIAIVLDMAATITTTTTATTPDPISPLLRRFSVCREAIPGVLHPDNVAVQSFSHDFKAPSADKTQVSTTANDGHASRYKKLPPIPDVL